MTSWDFHETRALVTGASSGIGRATALLLAQAGARVMATARNHDALKALSEEAGGAGTIDALAGDLTDETFRRKLVNQTAGSLGGLDLLVNAAGIIASADWEHTSLEEWDRMMDINLRSLFALTRLALPHIRKTRGSIVNVSSVTGTRAFPGVLAYCVSKAATDQLTRCLALELAPAGVRVNAVNPGVVVTNLHRAGGMPEDKYAAFLEHSKSTHPLGRVGRPEEVAAAIAYLASSEAGWITGVTLPVDGGRHQTAAR